MLSERLTDMQHDHHHNILSTLHVHLDHDNCLETIVLRGLYKQVNAFGNSVIAQNGVRHGNIHVVQVALDTPSVAQHGHMHFHPNT